MNSKAVADESRFRHMFNTGESIQNRLAIGDDRIGSKTCFHVFAMQVARDTLKTELADLQRAHARGYFDPDEDERIRAAFARYE